MTFVIMYRPYMYGRRGLRTMKVKAEDRMMAQVDFMNRSPGARILAIFDR